jgi:hypothetical protein
MRVVSFHYTLRDTSDRVLDTSAGGEPITYLEGAGQIIPGLDEELRDAQLGEKRRVQVPAAKAYGERDPDQVQRIKRLQLPVGGDRRRRCFARCEPPSGWSGFGVRRPGYRGAATDHHRTRTWPCPWRRRRL